MTLKGDTKFKEKLICGLEKDKEFVEFPCEQSKV